MLRICRAIRSERWLSAALPALLALPVPAAAEAPDLREIVVTARRIEERTLDIPLNVSVTSGEGIGAGAVESIHTLAARTPGLSFDAIGGGVALSANAPILRGQAQPSIFGDAVASSMPGSSPASWASSSATRCSIARRFATPSTTSLICAGVNGLGR